MFLVLRCGQNCSILVWPPQRPCDLYLTKTKIYLPKLPSMLNLKSIHPLGAIVQHRLSEEPDFAIPLYQNQSLISLLPTRVGKKCVLLALLNNCKAAQSAYTGGQKIGLWELDKQQIFLLLCYRQSYLLFTRSFTYLILECLPPLVCCKSI